MNSLNRTARMVGVLYLAITFIAPFSMLYIPSVLFVPADAALTASHIRSSEGLFRMGIASDSLVFLIEIILTTLLYKLLKPVNQTLSLAAAFSRLAMTIIQGVNVIYYLFVLVLVSQVGNLSSLSVDLSNYLISLFLNAHGYVVLVWGLFFALHLLIIAWLVYRSGYIPKWVGLVLFITGLCYLTQNFGGILFPNGKQIWDVVGSFSMIEVIFPIWLLIKGVKNAPSDKGPAK